VTAALSSPSLAEPSIAQDVYARPAPRGSTRLPGRIRSYDYWRLSARRLRLGPKPLHPRAASRGLVMQTVWRVMHNGVLIDTPFGTADVAAALSAGQFSSDTLVYSETEMQWLPLHRAPELAGFFGRSKNTDAPTAASSPPPPRKKQYGKHRWVAALSAVALAAMGTASYFLLVPGAVARSAATEDAIVQIRAGASSGTGFFVQGPDEWAYVATAFHVVDCGCAVSVARAIEIAAGKYYIQSYPDAEVVAFDADTDLAILRLTNVRAKTFGVLPLAKTVLKNDEIKAYGFPGRTLVKDQGLLSQEGKILGLGKFPVLDRTSGQVLKENNTDGLLISASIEPGYSGGPTCNKRGEVVGITALKDVTKTQHNGAISVLELSKLLSNVAPLDKDAPPTAEQVEALIRRVGNEYLSLPPEKRVSVREIDFIALSDLPDLKAFTSYIRRMEAGTHAEFDKDGQVVSLSNSAILGLSLATHAGTPLETYRGDPVQESLAACEKSARGVQDLLARLSSDDTKGEPSAAFDAAMANCDEQAKRPVTWDLVAITLQWEGELPQLSVAKIERIDQQSHTFRATVLAKGSKKSFDIWVESQNGQLRLKLFDNEKRAYGLTASRHLASQEINGSWSSVTPKTPFRRYPQITYTQTHTLDISAGSDGQVRASHTIKVTVFGQFNNCYRTEFSGWREQRMTGKIEDGATILQVKNKTQDLSQFAACSLGEIFPYSFDVAMTVKKTKSSLVAYPTSGEEFPDEVVFTAAK
jgi:S1-C subfamily serine protease